MTTLREAASMAKRIIAERMCSDCDGHICCWADGAFVLSAIDAALAAKEPEPVAWVYNAGTENRITFIDPHPIRQDAIPLYTAPLQREWVGLTDEEILELKRKAVESPINAIMDAEAKLKEKNQ